MQVAEVLNIEILSTIWKIAIKTVYVCTFYYQCSVRWGYYFLLY